MAKRKIAQPRVVKEYGPAVFRVLQSRTMEERMDPSYWNPRWWREINEPLETCPFPVDPLGRQNADGEDIGHIARITYGQVGQREYDEEGEVQYIQVRNLRWTGIDVYERYARVRIGSHNDPPRSRVEQGDLLLINSGVGSIGRSIAVVEDPGLMNISQDIDKIRFRDLEAPFVAVFLRSKYGAEQIERICTGVSGQVKIDFDEVRSLVIPIFPEGVQKQISAAYRQMAQKHTHAVAAKARLLQCERQGNLRAAERYRREYEQHLRMAEAMLGDLVRQVEEVIEGTRTEIDLVTRVLEREEVSA